MMGIAALTSGLFGLAGAALTAQGAKSAAASTAQAQASMDQASFDYNHDEAMLARDWQAWQSDIERQFSHQEAEIQRQYAERMSNSAHQRELADLKAAGLNPILAANNGAPVGNLASASAVNVPSGAVASSHPSKAATKPNVLGSFVGSVMESMRLNNDFKRVEIESAKADINKTEAETHRMDAETNRARQESDASKVRAEIDRINNDIDIAIKDLGIREELKNASVEEKHAMIGKLMSDIGLNREMAAKIGMEKEELERRIRYGTLLSDYLPLEAREIVGEHMIDFVRENKDAINFFVDNMNGKYELSEADGSKLWKKCLDWMIKKGYLKDSEK